MSVPLQGSIQGARLHHGVDSERSPARRVVVTGLGVVAPNGLGREAFWDSTQRGGSFITAIDRFDTESYSCRIGGAVAGFRAADFLPHLTIKQTDRATQMALAACQMATEDAGLDLRAEDPRQVGMYFANVFGGMEFAERELYTQSFIGSDRVSAYQSIAWFFAATQGQWSISEGIKGFGKSIVADRAGGHQALLLGALAIRQGHASVVYAGGFEAPLVPYVFRIHEGSRLLSKATANPGRSYRPFDAGRTGLVLAEGSAILILEEAERARRRGARIYAELAGGALNCDGRQAPELTSRILATCLRRAVADAGIEPESVDCVLPEGVAVRDHDYREARAIHEAFGTARPTVCVPKARTGHALAASGPLDAAWGCLMLRHGTEPPPVNLEHPDGGDVPLPVTGGAAPGRRLETLVCCGSGYGGVNTAVVLTRHGAPQGEGAADA